MRSGDLLDTLVPFSCVFDAAVLSNIATAEPWAIPSSYVPRIWLYARANPDDGSVLLPALQRQPRVFRGGWILKANPSALAITLGRDIFFSTDVEDLPLHSFVHELVHVQQYAILGAIPFLTSYFGMSAAVIAQRLAHREPIGFMRASIHEDQAYCLEGRFNQWEGGQG